MNYAALLAESSGGLLGLSWTDFLLHLLNFAILITAAAFLIYKPVTKFMRERRESIRKQIDENKQKSEEADRLKEEYSERLTQADREISEKNKLADERIAARTGEMLDEGKRRAEQIVRRAEEEAKAERAKAMNAVKDDVAEAAVMIASGILEREITSEENDKIIDECLKEWADND